MPARAAAEQLSRGVAQSCDRFLDFLVLAFAAWTVIYHVSLVLGIDALWAGAAGVAALVPSGWVAFRPRTREPRPRNDEARRARSTRRVTAARLVTVLAAAACAALFAFAEAPWPAVWLLWVTAAGAAVIATTLGVAGASADDGREPDRDDVPPQPGTIVALAWGVALAVLSLFLVDPDPDDTHYVHLTAWVAAHGEFPVRDTLFSTEDLPAIIFPPLSSFEALAGTIARATGLAAPDLVYLVVTPVASALAVLAVWRLLRTWRVRMVGLALSVAMVFLLTAAQEHRTLGQLFITRIWQGKIVFLAVLVPLLFALLAEYAEQPTGRRLALVAAAGAAAVGLTSTAVFVVPVVAAGALLPVAVRSPRRAAGGMVAAVAYPLAAAAGIAVVGARNAEVSRASGVVPERLAEFVLGDGVLALVTVAAVLMAPILIRRRFAGAMVATTVLLVGFLYAPTVPLRVFRLTGLGEVQWRWTWAIPAAALVGVLATGVLARVRVPALRVVPAALLVTALAVWGTPVWSSEAEATVAPKPAWKRPPETVEAAERILAHLRPGERVLAPRSVTQTVLVMSGTATAVAPRGFYTRALRGVPGGDARERLLLMRFAEEGLGRSQASSRRTVEGRDVVRALRVVGVDLACVPSEDTAARRLLVAHGYSPAASTESLVCLRAPGPR